jgi:hypothetical protein
VNNNELSTISQSGHTEGQDRGNAAEEEQRKRRVARGRVARSG